MHVALDLLYVFDNIILLRFRAATFEMSVSSIFPFQTLVVSLQLFEVLSCL